MHDMECVVGLKNKPHTDYGRSTNLVVYERYAVVVLFWSSPSPVATFTDFVLQQLHM